MGVTHALVSTVPDSGTAGEVSSDEWNAAHQIDTSGVLLGRVTAGPGAIEAISAATAKALLAIGIGDVSGLTTALSALASALTGLAAIATSGSASDLTGGTVDAARMPALAGDVTSSAGSTTTALAAHVVANAKLAQMAGLRIKGNASGSTADADDLTAAQAKGVLAIASGDVSGLAAVATSGSATDLGAGTLPAARLPALSGDVATSAGSAVTTIQPAAVSNAKLANMAASTIKGNNTTTGAPLDLTVAQTKTLLAIASTDVSGLATIATSGSATDLGSGTVPAARMPAHTGDVTSSAGSVALTVANDAVTYAKLQNISATQRVLGRNTAAAGDTEEVTASQLFDWVSSTNGVLLTRTAGTWAAVANVAADGGDLLFTENTSPTAPTGSKVKAFCATSGGRPMLAAVGPTGAKMIAQPFLGQQHIARWVTGVNNAIVTEGMIAPTPIGTGTGRTPATTNSFTISRRIGLVSAASAGAIGGLRNTVGFMCRQGGFHYVIRCGIGDASIITTGRTFFGLTLSTIAPTDVDPSGLTNLIGIGTDANDTGFQFYAAGAVAQARIALPAAFVANTASTDFYELSLYCAPGASTITYQVSRLNGTEITTGSLTGAQVPTSTTFLTPQCWRTNGSTAAQVAIDLFSMYAETDT